MSTSCQPCFVILQCNQLRIFNVTKKQLSEVEFEIPKAVKIQQTHGKLLWQQKKRKQAL